MRGGHVRGGGDRRLGRRGRRRCGSGRFRLDACGLRRWGFRGRGHGLELAVDDQPLPRRHVDGHHRRLPRVDPFETDVVTASGRQRVVGVTSSAGSGVPSSTTRAPGGSLRSVRRAWESAILASRVRTSLPTRDRRDCQASPPRRGGSTWPGETTGRTPRPTRRHRRARGREPLREANGTAARLPAAAPTHGERRPAPRRAPWPRERRALRGTRPRPDPAPMRRRSRSRGRRSSRPGRAASA